MLFESYCYYIIIVRLAIVFANNKSIYNIYYTSKKTYCIFIAPSSTQPRLIFSSSPPCIHNYNIGDQRYGII